MEPVVLHAKVVANAKKFEFLEATDWKHNITIKTKNSARNNRANQEIIQELKKKFNQKITILKGHKSNQKIIQIG